MPDTSKIITSQQAFARMARLCARKEYCASDIRRKLKMLNVSDDAANDIIAKLQKERYIDESRFARNFISDKLRFNKWGKNKIESALRQKQIPRAIMDDAFAEFSDQSMRQSLQPLLEKKLKSVTGKSAYEKNAKLIRYASGRGFAMNDILNCLRAMNLGDATDNEW